MIWLRLQEEDVPIYETLDEIYRLIVPQSSFFFHCLLENEPTYGLYDKNCNIFGFHRKNPNSFSAKSRNLEQTRTGEEIIYWVDDYSGVLTHANQDRPLIVCSDSHIVWNVTRKIRYDNPES